MTTIATDKELTERGVMVISTLDTYFPSKPSLTPSQPPLSPSQPPLMPPKELQPNFQAS